MGSSNHMGHHPTQCTSHPSSMSGSAQAAFSSIESQYKYPSFQPAISQSSADISTPGKSMSAPNSDIGRVHNVFSPQEVDSALTIFENQQVEGRTQPASGSSLYSQVGHFTPIHPSIVSETAYAEFASFGSNGGCIQIKEVPSFCSLSVSTNVSSTPKSVSGSILSLPTNLSNPTVPPNLARHGEKHLSSASVKSNSESLDAVTPVRYQNNSPYSNNVLTPARSNLPSSEFNLESLTLMKGSILSLEKFQHSQSATTKTSTKSVEHSDFPQLDSSCVPVMDTSSVVASISRGPELPVNSTNCSSNTTPSHWSISPGTVLSPVNTNPIIYSSELPPTNIVKKSGGVEKESSSISTPANTDRQYFFSDSTSREAALKSFTSSLQAMQISQEIPPQSSLHTPSNTTSSAEADKAIPWKMPHTHSQDTLQNCSPLSSTPLHRYHTGSVEQSMTSSEGCHQSLSSHTSPVLITPLLSHHETSRVHSPLQRDFQYSLLRNDCESGHNNNEFDYSSSNSAKLSSFSSSEQQDSTLDNSGSNNYYSQHSSDRNGRFLGKLSNAENEELLHQSDDANQENFDDLMDNTNDSDSYGEPASNNSNFVDGFNSESPDFEPTFDSGTYSITSHFDIDDALTSPSFSLRRSNRFSISEPPFESSSDHATHVPTRRNAHAYDRVSYSSAGRESCSSNKRNSLRKKSYDCSTQSFNNFSQSDMPQNYQPTPLGSPNKYYKIRTPTKFPELSPHGTSSRYVTSSPVTPSHESISTNIKHKVSELQSRQPLSQNEPNWIGNSAVSSRNSSGSTALWVPQATAFNPHSKSTKSNVSATRHHSRLTGSHANSVKSPYHSYNNYSTIRRNYPSTSSKYSNISSYTERHQPSSTSTDYIATGAHLHNHSDHQRYYSTDKSYSPIHKREAMASFQAKQDTNGSINRHPYHRATTGQSLERERLMLNCSPQRHGTSRQGKSPRRGPRYSKRADYKRRNTVQVWFNILFLCSEVVK